MVFCVLFFFIFFVLTAGSLLFFLYPECIKLDPRLGVLKQKV